MNKNSSETGFFRFRLQEESHDSRKSTIRRRIVVRPEYQAVPGVDEDFARQVAEFIDEYRPALEALAK